MRIYLIGFMGSGKSSLGRVVSERLQVPFIDTDAEVEYREAESILNIFRKKGEPYFRDLESTVLRESARFPKALIATGGGLPCHDDNMNWIARHGVSIYLEWSLAWLQEQLLGQRESRPLIAGNSEEEARQRITELFLDRKAFYEQAAMTLEMRPRMEDNIVLLEKACKYIW